MVNMSLYVGRFSFSYHFIRILTFRKGEDANEFNLDRSSTRGEIFVLEFGMYASVHDALPAPFLFSSSFVVYILLLV